MTWPSLRGPRGFLVVAALAVVAVALEPVSIPLHAAQRFPRLTREELPMGLGIVQVAPVPGQVLLFFGEPGIGQRPGDYPASDQVLFGRGVPSVAIAEAPPWLVPEHLKMDYELFQLRVMTLTPTWVEVIGNSTTGQTWWIDRSVTTFKAWPDFLLQTSSVVPFREIAVHARPLDTSPVLATTAVALVPLAVQGDWLKVAIGHLADRMPPEGWIRWRRGERLLVSYNPLS